MKKEKTLNEKIIEHCMGTPVVCTKIIKDVKESVKKLKDKFESDRKFFKWGAWGFFEESIDKIFGDFK